MKKYKHWLKLGGNYSEEEEYKEIDDYLKRYPDAKATIYQYNYTLFDKVVLLECEQNYNDLDMMVNSMSNNLYRLTQKPKNIGNPKEFIIPEYIKKKLAS